ncbi:MAG: ribbon-helix-helix protein, CopG family [Phycicoccus sp.]
MVKIANLFVYDVSVRKRLLHGKPVTDEQIQAWADEAEAGYDLSKLPKPRRGRPPVGDGPGTVVPVRLDEATIAALTARAEAEGIATRSDAIRAAVREWARIA